VTGREAAAVGAELATLRELACRLAVEAGTLAAEGRRGDVESGGSRAAMTAATKSSRTDVVTRHDRAAEALIVDGLRRARPDDAIVGEEGANQAGTSGVAWLIDPIDGTTNFLYGLPMWSTSVGAIDADGPAAGAVYIPATNDLFAAARGQGATRNGVPIAASGELELSLALVATGFGYTPERRRAQAARLADIAPVIRDIRRSGSAAIDLCYTAAGLVDAFFEENLNAWDIAAGELIAREAGCRSGDFRGGPLTPAEVLVATPAIFDDLAALLAP
jgi:myo-inositol-1(or 4)-monophosphatase